MARRKPPAPPPAAPPAFTDEIASNDLRKALSALRDKLADEIEKADRCECGKGASSAVASLARQLSDTLKTLNTLGTGDEKSEVDELAKRRAARQARAAVPKRAAKSVKRRTGGSRARS